MNFLAHLALAGPSDASRVGNLLGDFEKGTPASLAERHAPEIVAGILMHRQLDRHTDDHPSFRAAKLLLAPERRRFAGILLDLYFDHLLHRHWPRFHPGTAEDFIAGIHHTLERRRDWLGPNFGPLAPLLRQQNWLGSYATLPGLQLTLDRVSRRSPRFAPLREGLQDYLRQEGEIEELFLALYPDLRARANLLLGNKTLITPSFP
ncbi:ACP phosphodiesterase [Roseibacillus ishigakijimensis]|uniref:DUF479 domain-containing protein n=1 Tax=Roseibacillus ishigakijimensis TaxID=454146 RepID=A0A934RPC1_9BACT|nr:ACP phosphodiesterase [Roseibacillus ishigakijimensis]MBK1833096.1 DUF479 domain-containing protein [Roseibacillus ishigakijimensis]